MMMQLEKYRKPLIVFVVSLSLLLAVGCKSIGYDEHMDYGIGLFADTSKGYSRIQSARREYSADEVICVTVSTAFLNTKEEAELARVIELYAEENPVFDVSFSIGQPQVIDWDQSQADFVLQDAYWVQELPSDEISLDDLVYNRTLFNTVKRRDFDFKFQAYLKVKDDAPENWSGRILLCGFLSGEEDQYGNPVGRGFMADYFSFTKQGDTIIFR